MPRMFLQCSPAGAEKTIWLNSRAGVDHNASLRDRRTPFWCTHHDKHRQELIECGQHWEAAAIAVAKDSTARFLTLSGVVDSDDLPANWVTTSSVAQRVVHVADAIVATSMDFRFAGAYTGLESFPRAGTVIAWRDGEPVVTPYDDCVLVMPSLRQLRPGVTVARLGKLIAR